MMAAFTVLLPLALGAREARAEDDSALVSPVLDLAMGPAFHFSPKPSNVTQFALDVDAGAFIMLGPRLRYAINPQLGYSYDHLGLHAFNLGAGVGIGNPWVYLMYTPRLIAGKLNGEGAIGMRNSLGANFFFDAARLEVGHQFIESGGVLFHDVHLVLGINPLAVFVLLQDPFRWAKETVRPILLPP